MERVQRFVEQSSGNWNTIHLWAFVSTIVISIIVTAISPTRNDAAQRVPKAPDISAGISPIHGLSSLLRMVMRPKAFPPLTLFSLISLFGMIERSYRFFACVMA